jgi:DNA repair protein RecN (Recombination protein N)
MLKSLKIQNYALIDSIAIDFEKGFNAITGETGAGKSILLGALALILGKRVDTSVLFNADKKCIVEGGFSLSGEKQKDFLRNNDLDIEDINLIRREINSNGKSRAFINDTPVNLSILNSFASLLLDIHSQYQTLLLSDSRFQFSILDTFANNHSLLEHYQQSFQQLKRQEEQLHVLEAREKNAKKDLDYLSFQQKEIADLQLDIETDSQIENELLTLSNAEKIRETLHFLLYRFDESEESLLSILGEIRKQLGEISNYHPRLAEFHEQLQSFEIESKELLPEVSSFMDTIDIDNQRLDELNQRNNLINALYLKHQLSKVEDLLKLEKDLSEQIASITSLETDIADCRKEIASIRLQLEKEANALSEKRKQSIPSLEKQIIELLAKVGMKNARLSFRISHSEKHQFDEFGLDNLEILFSSNTGVPMQEITKVASGGELSRLMLCIKYILAGSALLPSIIFDEIDLGISGEIAFKVGELMAHMSEKHQVIAITHLPQVASFANAHFRVYKQSDQQTTHTHLTKLDEQERILELAKMIGGENPSPSAIENARELVKNFS